MFENFHNLMEDINYRFKKLSDPKHNKPKEVHAQPFHNQTN